MAGARARKLDLSGFLAGNSRTASIIANTDQSGGIGGLLGGIAGGISKFGANRREDKRLADAKAERESVRAEDRAYRAKRDAFNDSLALKADARAEADQKMQEDRFGWEQQDRAGGSAETDSLIASAAAFTKKGDIARQIAADTKVGESFVTALGREIAASATGMPTDPKTIKQISDAYTTLQAKGGLGAVMARGASLKEDDIPGLIAETKQISELKSLLTIRMTREKNTVKHAALGDALMQLSAIEGVNEYRLKLHDANTKRKSAESEAQAKEQKSLASARALALGGKVPQAQVDEWMKTPGMTGDALEKLALGAMSAEKAREALAAKTLTPDQEEAKAVREGQLEGIKAGARDKANPKPEKPTKPVMSESDKLAASAQKKLEAKSDKEIGLILIDLPTNEVAAFLQNPNTSPNMKRLAAEEMKKRGIDPSALPAPSSYPSWMPSDPEKRRRWDELPQAEKDKVLKVKGR